MKGRPILGVISGFLFGLFGGITLFLFGVIPLDSHLLWILPIAGVVLGLFMATWAPFGKGTTDQSSPAPATQVEAPPNESTPTEEPTAE
jgi:hypothetical protein